MGEIDAKRVGFPHVKVVAEALRWCAMYLQSGTWPYDHWITLGEGWDLNLYVNDLETDAELCASIYPAKEGRTDTSKSYQVFAFVLEDDELVD